MNSAGPKAEPTRVLFLCVGNSCRSQIAEAMARHFYPELIEAESAGTMPLGRVATMTLAALQERGIRAEGLYSKGIDDALVIFNPEVVVNISGRTVDSLFGSASVIDWDVEDPYGSDLEIYRRICKEIEKRLRKLAAELRKGRKS